MISRDAARRHLDALAREPRPAGSEAEAHARAYCAGVLHSVGMQVAEEPFTYSALPGLWATPAFGLGAIGSLLAALAVARAGHPEAAVGILVAALVVMAVGGVWLARHGVVRLPLLRRGGVNLVARRGDGEPRLWLMAHLDSKSQPVPMLLRAGGITLTGVVWIVAIALLVAQSGGLTGAGWIPWVALAGVVTGAPIAASLVKARSPGAVDDASGVAAVLLAAQAVSDVPLGVVLTSAEELGLAGARGWALAQAPATAVNCDGLDDAGVLAAMHSGRGAARLLEAFVRAAGREGIRARCHRILPGVMVDGTALADAGWEVITLSKGTVHTLRRIHTPGDSLEALTGEGVAEAVRVLTGMVRELAR